MPRSDPIPRVAARERIVPLVCALLLLTGAARGQAADPLAGAEALGPSGRRVFAVELDPGLGLRGRFGYATTTEGFVDPLVLALFEDGREVALSPDGQTARGSHLETRWRGDGLAVREQRFVTATDELVDRLTLRNDSARPRDLELRLSSPLAPLLDRFRSRQLQVDLSSLPGERLPEPLVPGALQYDGVQHALVEAVPVGRPGGVAVPLPAVRPARATVHLLLAGPVDATWVFDDGSHEALAWLAPLSAERVSWRRLGAAAPAQLSYDPPPGRFVERVVLAGRGPAPALLAATVELPPDTGRLPVLFGQPEWHGLPVTLALAGDGFTSAPAGESSRSLLRRVVLPPGGEVVCTLLLAVGERRFLTALGALGRAEDPELLVAHEDATDRWWQRHVPRFACADPTLERAWQQRWERLRRRTLRLDLPGFSLPVCYPGLGDAEHTRISPADEALFAELRWMREPDVVAGQARALLMAPSADGRLAPVALGGRFAPVPHRLALSVVDAYAVHGVRAYLDECVPLLARDLQATRREDPTVDHAAADAALAAVGDGGGVGVGVGGAKPTRDGLVASDGSDGSDRDGSDSSDSSDGVGGAMPARDGLVAHDGSARSNAVPAITSAEAWAALQRAAHAELLEGAERAPSSDGCRDGLHTAFVDRVVRDLVGFLPRLDERLALSPRIDALVWWRLDGLRSHGREVDLAWDAPDGERCWEDRPEGFSLFVDGELRFHADALVDAVIE